MTQIVFLLFEDLSQPEKSEDRYRVHIHFSPGVRCRDELAGFNEAKKTSPELLGKPLQAHFVKRLPVHAAESPTQRRYSHDSNQPLDALDMAKSEKLVVRRQSDQFSQMKSSNSLPMCVHSESRFKSFSETEVLSARKALTTLADATPTQRNDINTRSKSLDVLTSSSPQEPSFLKTFPKKLDLAKKKTVPTVLNQDALVTFKIEEVDEISDGNDRSSNKSPVVMGQGSNEKLNRAKQAAEVDPLASNSLSERGQ